MFYNFLIPAIWIVWFLYWYFSGLDLKKTIRQESGAMRVLYTILLVAGASLFTFNVPRIPFLYAQIWPQTLLAFWLGVAVLLLGFAFTSWARRTLGRNWSSTVTMKEDHELVVRGPYALVRHPIYTGLLIMFLGTAIAVGQWRGLISIALVLLSFLIKLRIEERYMVELFGDQYVAYRKRVAMLIPWLW